MDFQKFRRVHRSKTGKHWLILSMFSPLLLHIKCVFLKEVYPIKYCTSYSNNTSHCFTFTIHTITKNSPARSINENLPCNLLLFLTTTHYYITLIYIHKLLASIYNNYVINNNWKITWTFQIVQLVSKWWQWTTASESRHKGINAPSFSLVVDAEKRRPNHWQNSMLTLLVWSGIIKT